MIEKMYYIRRNNGRIWEVPTQEEIENSKDIIVLNNEKLPNFEQAEVGRIYEINAVADEYIKITKDQLNRLAQAIIDQARYDKINRQVKSLFFLDEEHAPYEYYLYNKDRDAFDLISEHEALQNVSEKEYYDIKEIEYVIDKNENYIYRRKKDSFMSGLEQIGNTIAQDIMCGALNDEDIKDVVFLKPLVGVSPAPNNLYPHITTMTISDKFFHVNGIAGRYMCNNMQNLKEIRVLKEGNYSPSNSLIFINCPQLENIGLFQKNQNGELQKIEEPIIVSSLDNTFKGCNNLKFYGIFQYENSQWVEKESFQINVPYLEVNKLPEENIDANIQYIIHYIKIDEATRLLDDSNCKFFPILNMKEGTEIDVIDLTNPNIIELNCSKIGNHTRGTSIRKLPKNIKNFKISANKINIIGYKVYDNYAPFRYLINFKLNNPECIISFNDTQVFNKSRISNLFFSYSDPAEALYVDGTEYNKNNTVLKLAEDNKYYRYMARTDTSKNWIDSEWEKIDFTFYYPNTLNLSKNKPFVDFKEALENNDYFKYWAKCEAFEVN